MSLTAAQRSAFQANAGYPASDLSLLILGASFAVLILWGVWAMRTAYVGWSEQRINQRQFLGVVIRFLAMYLVLSFFLLS